MSRCTIGSLCEQARQVVVSLNWEIYHTPENLTLFLLGEAAELGDFCQWCSKGELLKSPRVLAAVKEEIADVVKSVLYLANVLPLPLSLASLLTAKLAVDEKYYSIKKFKGVHRYVVKTEERRKEGIPKLPGRRAKEDQTVSDMQKSAWDFVKAREWQQFYSPASLALAVCVKSGEVATCFQRRPKPVTDPFPRLLWAMADVLLNTLRLAECLGFTDVADLVSEKLKLDETRFKRTDTPNQKAG